jgi:hypothetical protein
MKIDLRGHNFPIEIIEEEISRQLKLFDSLEKKYPGFKMDMFVAPMFPHCSCRTCGERISFKTLNSEETSTSVTECPYKEGFPPIEAMLEIPSGEILLFNDLREFYDREAGIIDINNTLGIKRYTEHYAKQGLIMHFIGNTCASVVQVNDERIEIGYFGCEKEEDCDFVEKNEIGSICTDLWWYCAVNKDTFEKRVGKTVEQIEDEYHATGAWPDILRAKVTPGTYRTVGQYHIDEDRLFSYIEKVK